MQFPRFIFQFTTHHSLTHHSLFMGPLTTHSSGCGLLTPNYGLVKILFFSQRLTRADSVMEILISADRIQERVGELAREIGGRFQGRPVTILGVLTGSLMFLADLVRRLDLPLRIGLIQASSYRGPVTTAGTLHVDPELL